MMKIGFFLLTVLIIVGCKNTETSISSDETAYQREPTMLAVEVRVEKTSPAANFRVLQIQIDTLEYAVSPRPTDENLPEVFKAEVLNASNKVVFGSEYKTRFISEEDRDIANLKFFCSLTPDAVRTKIYYRVSEGVWKQIETIEL